jgi:hypothetical protein
MIKKENGKWVLYSSDGSKKLGGPYDTEQDAIDRERQVQYFKNHKEADDMPKVTKEKGVAVPSGFGVKAPLVKALRKALGIEEAGNAQGLVDTFGDWAGGSVNKCIGQLEGKEGIEDAPTLCAWMKDQWSGTTEWRGDEESAEESYWDNTGSYNMGGAIPYIPINVVTFEDMKKVQQATDLVEGIKKLNWQFCQMIDNIIWNSEIEDKPSALYSLVYEYSALLPQDMQVSMSATAEAATIKAAVKSAIKSLNALLEDKTLPKTVISQVKALKETFRKTWADLESEASEELPEVEETQESQDDPGSPLAEKVVESFEGTVTAVASEGTPEPSGIELEVALIKPGWGNTRDNHFYPAELLRDSAMMEKFVGSKMYETDHRPGEKSTRTWVSTVTGIRGVTSDGAPIARVAVHDPNFAERIINLESQGLLGKMECSILADAIAERKVYEENGRKGKKILEITNVESVDWVTRAGAGGHALKVAEGEDGSQVLEEGTQTPEPEVEPTQVIETQEGGTVMPLPIEKVKEVLGTSRLPQVSQERLAEGSYEDEAALEVAIAAEVEYLKVVTSSGKPFSVGETAGQEPERLSEANISSNLDKIDQAFGIK